MAYLNPKHLNLLVGKLYDQVLRTIRETEEKKEKNIILFTGKIFGHIIDAIRTYQKKEGISFRIALFHDAKTKLDATSEQHRDKLDLILSCDITDDAAIQKTFLQYQDELLAITCRSESEIPLLARLIPFLPYLNAPTTESLRWATDKILMRERMSVHNPSMIPAFRVISEVTQATLKEVEEEVEFPMIIKPAGLGASRLVTICYHKEELEDELKKVLKKIQSVYKDAGGKWEPRVLVEHFIEGDMYSIDAYVTGQGAIAFCPVVHIKTGKTIGFDDFFGYQQITPTLLNTESIAGVHAVATSAIYALGLKHTTAHIELFKTEDGWKIIEVGPRVGGFRHMMYECSHGINHTMNDILVRIGKKTIVPKKTKGYSVAMKFFAKEEGKLTRLGGVKKIQELKSFKTIYIHKQIGDHCAYAKNGGSSVFDIIMFNKERPALLADIRRLEQTIDI